MPSLTYTRDIPNPPNAPSTDVPNMKTNTNSIDTIWQADHFTFSATNPGIHKQSTYETKGSSDVPTSVTQGAVYTKTISSIVQLFYRRNSNATPIQITGPASLSGFIGYQFLPGGLILQWGFVNGTHGANLTFNPGDTGSVTFPLAFPNKIFTVTTSLNFNTNTAGSPATGSALIVAMDYFNTTNSGFNWRTAGSGGSYTVFYWTALGF